MKPSLIKNASGFDTGLSKISKMADYDNKLGIAFSILKLKQNETYVLESQLETAVLLMTGQVVFQYGSKVYEGQRDNIFEQDPHVWHGCKNQRLEVIAGTDCELALMQVENAAEFETTVFNSENMLESEDRGIGLLNNTSYRIVRTVFDKRNRAESNLVVGEVINFPGCWSSYPPHHHSQPEIYHYRFTEPQGFGHAQCGDEVMRSGEGDTLIIMDEKDHAQVAAPGYGMYYLWFIRHLPDNPYIVPEFSDEHAWTKSTDANQRVWDPKKRSKD